VTVILEKVKIAAIINNSSFFLIITHPSFFSISEKL
jgi:hypothetical protein